jgi:hypothetical protein
LREQEVIMTFAEQFASLPNTLSPAQLFLIGVACIAAALATRLLSRRLMARAFFDFAQFRS